MESSIQRVDDSNHVKMYPPPFMSEPKEYALSGKIMLSAIIILFAVVVIMVCFHIYARWYIFRARSRNIRRARRRTHLVFYIDSNDSSNVTPIPTRGLDAQVINSLPTFVYDGKIHSTYDGKNMKMIDVDGDVLECAVCLSEFEESEQGRILPKCNHCFHVECIDMWFQSQDTCPLCRTPVDPNDLPIEMDETEVVVEMGELTSSQHGSSVELDPSPVVQVGHSTSFGGRRKGADIVGVTIEVPRRCQSFSFSNNLDESGSSRSPTQGFRSPTSRVLSFKRFLGMDKKSPSPSPSGVGTELDVELGGNDRATPSSQSLTPR